MTEVTLSITMEINALNDAADMLHSMAAALTLVTDKSSSNYNNITILSDTDKDAAIPTRTDRDHPPLISPNADDEGYVSADLSDKNTTEPDTDKDVVEFEDASHGPLPPLESLQEVIEPISPPPLVHPGVELDSAGLPYDARIHTKGKNKITKKDGKWKYARNIDPKLIKTVEAELRAAMNAKPIESVETAPNANEVLHRNEPRANTPTPDAPTVVVDLYLIDGKEFTVDELHLAGWNDDQMKQYKIANDTPLTMTFPEFMAKVTPALGATLINDAMINTALNRQGLASLPILAARPDLIPVIHDELFSE